MSEIDSSAANARDVPRGVLPSGTHLGNYNLISVLGQGSFGITYLARDTTLDRDIAIKEYLPTSLALRENGTDVFPRSTEVTDEFIWGRERFLDEARTLAKLSRAPAIVRVYDFLRANGTVYMVMALAEGETLEQRLRRDGHLTSEGIERLLSSLLGGLEAVHAMGFLHRDIKPANIVLDAEDRPTLIDFGASRAEMAERTAAMTAIFTASYAAVEQFTSSKQGPWTDIYGLSATLYHAIVGHVPPSAIDRVLDDSYEPLKRLQPSGFRFGLLAGIDAGLAVRATDRPQSIAKWRAMISSEAATPGSVAATIVLDRHFDRTATQMMPCDAIVIPEAKPMLVKPARWVWGGGAAAAAAVLGLACGGYYFSTSTQLSPPSAPPSVATSAVKDKNTAAMADAARKAAEDQQKADAQKEAELQRKAEADEVLKRQIAEETRRQIEAQRIEQKRLDNETQQKSKADAMAKRRADEDAKKQADVNAEAKLKLEADDKKAAEMSETALHLTLLDRQHAQAALSGLGFNTNGTDGVLGPYSREMIASWQKARNHGVTGFLIGTQFQDLLREAAPTISRFDDEQKKFEDGRKKADEAKRRADDEAKGRANERMPVAPSVIAVSPAGPLPPTDLKSNVLKNAPLPGKLREGERVLVDDGTCPLGQIKQVTGGNDKKGTPRTSNCIASIGR